jgi:hypothetical protein
VIAAVYIGAVPGAGAGACQCCQCRLPLLPVPVVPRSTKYQVPRCLRAPCDCRPDIAPPWRPRAAERKDPWIPIAHSSHSMFAAAAAAAAAALLEIRVSCVLDAAFYSLPAARRWVPPCVPASSTCNTHEPELPATAHSFMQHCHRQHALPLRRPNRRRPQRTKSRHVVRIPPLFVLGRRLA